MSTKKCYSTAISITLFLTTLTLFSCAGNNAAREKQKIGDFIDHPRQLFFNGKDLIADQTPFKDQGGRGTCGAFAAIAAIEAAYKRDMNIELDLSEQYLHHIQKTAWLSFPKEKLYENQSCYWYGAGTKYYVAILENYRIPEERFCPYLTNRAMIHFKNQLKIKDFEWSAENAILQDTLDYFEYHPDHIPVSVYKNAKYGAGKINYIDKNDMKMDTLKYLLDHRHEVVLSIGDHFEGKNKKGAHFMCLIGHDDNKNEFIFKDSAVKGITRKSYKIISDNITAGKIDGFYIESVLKPQKQIEAGFLGRWYFCTDTIRGEMIIRRLGYHDPSVGSCHYFLRPTRLGSFYQKPYRYWDVNGEIAGNQMEFWLNLEKNHKQLTDFSGADCSVYIYNQGESAAHYMAGLYFDSKDSTEWGILLSKEPLPDQKHSDKEINWLDFKGLWFMEHDGWEGLLKIKKEKDLKKIDKLNHYEIKGWYTLLSTNKKYNIKGELKGGQITFTIPFDEKNPQQFKGYLLKSDRNIIAGRTEWANKFYGFHAFKK